MKLKLLLAVVASLVVMSIGHKHGIAEPTLPVNKIAVPDSLQSMTSTIDDINVPMEVLTQIQMKYQGYAVTGAQHINHNGKEAYQLRVDTDDQSSDYNGFYLFYDKNWQYLEEQKITAPPPPPVAPAPADPSKDQGNKDQPENPQPVAQPDANKPDDTQNPPTPSPDPNPGDQSPNNKPHPGHR